MTEREFIFNYWKIYIMLEKDFFETEKFVTVDEKNYTTFSSEYGKLILQIGSEVDVVAKILCELLGDSNASNISEYKRVILNNYQSFPFVCVSVLNHNIRFQPWLDFETDRKPIWWDIYNGYKHNRMAKEHRAYNYEKANLKNTLYALGGLYQLEIYTYCKLIDNMGKVPMPGSRLFQLIGENWNNVNFFQDVGIMIEGETLEMKIPDFQY